MKRIKLILLSLIVLAYAGCTDDDRDTNYLDNVPAPANLAVAFDITQDNSGLVTLTPNAEGATEFELTYGDGSGSVNLNPGESTEHVYAEGNYSVTLIATAVNGLTTEFTQPLVVSFIAPQNLVVTIENDGTLSKTVNITATADYALTYEVDFGENPEDEPVTANIGDAISYTYEDAGVYTITVTAFSAAIETTTYSEDFEVTAILQPLASAATPPSRAEDDVISLFSAVYTDVPTDYFPDWGQGGCCGSGWAMFDLEGDEMLQYSNLSYQGNQISTPVDVTEMEFIHLDVWTADELQNIEVSLISLTNGERPVLVPLTPNDWTSIDIPISAFTDQGGFTVADIHQLKYVGDPFGTFDDPSGTVFIDNIYFYREATGPAEAAPSPNIAEDFVISMFSDAYTDVPVDTWNTVWSQATFEDVTVNGNPTKKYTNLGFNGIETFIPGPSIDASGAGMTHFHLDIWTPNMTAFRVKLVDFLGDGFAGTNGDTEAELTYTPNLGEWMGIDIPLSDFADAGMGAFSDIAQLIISGDPFGDGVVFIDNVYYYNANPEPTDAAPTPTVPEANVISMFSDAYTDVPVDTWNTTWSVADYEEVNIAGNPTKKYTNLAFNGTETVNPGPSIDLTTAGMTHLHIDIWTPNITAFRVKLVDFLGDGFAGGNGDTEAELTFNPANGSWVGLEIPLSDFSDGGMSAFSDISQFIISCDPFG
ncbi:MAG: hypothetical protein KJN68_02935, partial [Bacteroidia bacterium]|nr:hypothetical protein [Bacteroidia bacterium]